MQSVWLRKSIENLGKCGKIHEIRHIRVCISVESSSLARSTYSVSFSFFFLLLLLCVYLHTPNVHIYLFICHENNQITVSSERTMTLWRTCVCVVAIFVSYRMSTYDAITFTALFDDFAMVFLRTPHFRWRWHSHAHMLTYRSHRITVCNVHWHWHNAI